MKKWKIGRTFGKAVVEGSGAKLQKLMTLLWKYAFLTGFKMHANTNQFNMKWQKNQFGSRQEGQHPLTWQRAANFRLLANQSAERRLVTQWRHGCRAMRRSVCNACASNAGRCICVRMSSERRYPLPIHRYHSKGNWLRYNLAADSFYIMKLCSRLLVLCCRNCQKNDKFR